MFNFFKIQIKMGRITDKAFLDFQLYKKRITEEQYKELVELLGQQGL